ncbi:MAG: DKNYY domain-containing protein [Flavobacteriaceae bacterium]|jgi:hypothetical protein|nr:DKNYY domain-containing protein [Flavobacteriaceae bacterium]
MKQAFYILILTLVSCSEGYQKIDGKWAYVSYEEAVGKRINYLDADNETFTILKNKEFATDKNNVYFVGGKIENAEPSSFVVLENGYSADKNNVFLDYETVIEADPKTFKLLDFPYAKDNKKIYCGTLPLLTSDINGFIVVKSGSIKTNELTTSFIKFNPEYAWIDTIKYKGVVYGEGIGKTNNEQFNGYKKK